MIRSDSICGKKVSYSVIFHVLSFTLRPLRRIENFEVSACLFVCLSTSRSTISFRNTMLLILENVVFKGLQ